MPKEKAEKLLCVDNLRHAEYYDMQRTFDNLYARSVNGEVFLDLMHIVLQRENILLAYRNIKSNEGSKTPGTDKLTIRDIGRLSADEVVEKVRYIVSGSKHGYRPKPVRRKDIPKPNGSTRPLGIPCIWDRLIQQCIKQVLEPICEAKFSENSYGFRPNRSVENAIARTYRLMQQVNLHYVVEVDIKGFFDNVNHSKLIRQIWALGIHDKHFLNKIKRILTAPIKMPDGTMVVPSKGTPQGGIISPLLANIVLNEFDHWIESQWQTNPVTEKYHISINSNGSLNRSNGYRAMRKTQLKEMYIVRYADDFRIFCRTKTDADKTMVAVKLWLTERLKLEISEEKSRVVNVKRGYSEFLGFKIKVQTKGEKQVVKSHLCDKQLAKQRNTLIAQAKNIVSPRKGWTEKREIHLYNSMVMGMQNYYCNATHITIDCRSLNRSVMTVFQNRLNRGKSVRLRKEGRPLTQAEKDRYGKSSMLRYVVGSDEPIYPIGCIRHINPMNHKRKVCCYTIEGRQEIHDNLRINTKLMRKLMLQPLFGRSAEFADNRISLFSAQWGKCAVTGVDFRTTEEIHCHHKTPKSQGGTDKYDNLILVLEPIHRLIHATDKTTIKHYISVLALKKPQLDKLNILREKVGLNIID